jgi:hypothetical protein
MQFDFRIQRLENYRNIETNSTALKNIEHFVSNHVFVTTAASASAIASSENRARR